MTCAMGPVKYFVARLQEILFKNRFDDSRRHYIRDLPNCTIPTQRGSSSWTLPGHNFPFVVIVECISCKWTRGI